MQRFLDVSLSSWGWVFGKNRARAIPFNIHTHPPPLLTRFSEGVGILKFLRGLTQKHAFFRGSNAENWLFSDGLTLKTHFFFGANVEKSLFLRGYALIISFPRGRPSGHPQDTQGVSRGLVNFG